MDSQLSRSARHEQIVAILLAGPQRSNRQIARQVGVDHKTVAAIRRQLIAAGRLQAIERTVGGDGKARPSDRVPQALGRALGGMAGRVADGMRRLIATPTSPARSFEDAVPAPPTITVPSANPPNPYTQPVECPRCGCREMHRVDRRRGLGRQIDVRQCRHCGRRVSFRVAKGHG